MSTPHSNRKHKKIPGRAQEIDSTDLSKVSGGSSPIHNGYGDGNSGVTYGEPTNDGGDWQTGMDGQAGSGPKTLGSDYVDPSTVPGIGPVI